MSGFSTKKIEELVDQGYAFSIRGFIGKAFCLIQMTPGLFIAYTILSFLISFSAQFIPVLGTIASVLITYPLLVGFYLAGHDLMKGHNLELSTFFRGFEYFGNLSFIYLIQVLAAVVIFVPLIISFGLGAFLTTDLNLDNLVPAFLLPVAGCLLIPFIYLSVSWIYAPLFVVFYKMGFWEAMEASRRIIHKRWWTYMSFIIVLGLIMMLGLFLLFIGILVAYPVAMVAVYVSFAEVTELQGNTEDDILDHLVS
ncbi:MAG: hypothetical protein HRU40_00855 [Saprospiraceae bacterium]|nr:hypothetical protein [Saprospiraceae bacterium]